MEKVGVQKNGHKHFYSNPGSPIKVHFDSKIDKNGNVIVYENGQENLYEQIQSYADSCNINLLVKRFEQGDINALNQRKAEFMDLTEMPNDYFEMVNKVNEFSRTFESLPVSIKEKFDNDVNKFIAKTGSEEWLNILTGKFDQKFVDEKPVVEEKKEEVKADESK